jgi:hypothetical protein
MADRFGYGEIGLDINPCRGCDDYDAPDGCKSNGGCEKPITNADRIRAMSDEELAKEIAWLVVEAFDQVVPEWKWKIDRDNRIAGTAKDMLVWLQSPADGGDDHA